ncbi:YkgJ family cysteine cluster protein [Desulfobacterales bacterium HSG16]|nr:YkgJ family cysteine cluster protein [Desulfobacterales bacterium HSG16]
MEITEEKAGIEPVRIGKNTRFKFKCHKDVTCFTQCCRGIKIVLTPYDIIRLKNRLQLSSHEFLAIYTTPHLLEKTDIPLVTLKLLDDEQDSCPFVKDGEGCIVYEDRPSTCRYYPLGVASMIHKDGADDDDFYFFVNEPHCKGFAEEKEWDVVEWRKDQGVDIHDSINAEWTDLIVRKRSFPPNVKLTEKSKQLFFMASYDIDKFKAFIFESSFLKRFDIDEKTVEKIKTDEIALLKFAMNWMKEVLFDQQQMKVENSENAEGK